jgi:hypothetical protein
LGSNFSVASRFKGVPNLALSKFYNLQVPVNRFCIGKISSKAKEKIENAKMKCILKVLKAKDDPQKKKKLQDFYIWFPISSQKYKRRIKEL